MILFRIGRLHAQGVGNRQRNHLELEVIQNPISDPGFNIFENGSLCHSTPITISVIPTLEIGFRIRPSEMPRTFQAIRGQNPGHPEGGGCGRDCRYVPSASPPTCPAPGDPKERFFSHREIGRSDTRVIVGHCPMQHAPAPWPRLPGSSWIPIRCWRFVRSKRGA